METLTIGLRSPWWLRALGRRHPLVRSSDRIEAVTLVIAVVVTVFAIPAAGAIGTSVHDARTRTYADQAHTTHQVIATATENGQLVPNGRTIGFSAEAMWSEAGKTHRADISWTDWPKVGDRQGIWVNKEGEHVAQPSPSRAAGEAIGIALAVWLGTAQVAVGLVQLIRRRLTHCRYAQWDREIQASRDNGGRTNNQS